MKMNFKRIVETSRTLFGVIGAAGYAGYLASMHTLWCLFSLSAMAVAWAGLYHYHAD